MTAPRRSNAVLRLVVAAFALLAVVLLSPAAASAAVKVGNVYTESNDTTHNQVIAFDRLSDGTLVEAQRINTGGRGEPSPACAMPPPFDVCPIVDSQGAVALNAAGTLLFAVNAGSDTISAFRVTSSGLVLVGVVPSGGDFPSSLTVHANELYVLNEHSGNIEGFTFSTTGVLSMIPGSKRSLATPGPSGAAAEVSFDRTGSTLTVTERNTNLIDTFVVTNGVAGPAVAHPSSGSTPFGFASDALGHLVVSDAGTPPDFVGAASTYQQTLRGGLTAIDTESSDGGAPCWVAITPDARYAFITNTVTKSVARFRIASDGTLTLLGVTPTTHTPSGAPVLFPTDDALSRDGRFLYVLVPGVFSATGFFGDTDVSRIDVYKVGTDGSLTFLSSTPENMPPGVSGLAAR
ncbi:MAG: 6-phosphogluconolactonase [Solirubrobacteraceae bacterium]|jgi:6-phosphogluconolactonase (cycloisomerase 2 family)|nr:6-phosphogluconolactonase [Solirubrobacteraceae bacterium]